MRHSGSTHPGDIKAFVRKAVGLTDGGPEADDRATGKGRGKDKGKDKDKDKGKGPDKGKGKGKEQPKPSGSTGQGGGGSSGGSKAKGKPGEHKATPSRTIKPSKAPGGGKK
jgi:hypothetical protein